MIAIAKASLQYVHAAVNSYWPSIPGATATETCDAERGDCDTPKPKTLPGKKDLRKLMANRKYSFKQNAAFIQKTDKTLRGAIVVIADCNHNDPKVQSDLTYFKRWGAKYGKEHGKDKLLLESPNEKGKKLSMMCEAWSPPATCVGIESSVLEQRLIDATSECLDAATNLIILMQEAGSPIAARSTDHLTKR
ncbi:hypothetical protein VARIO8X_120066 [Burkholderiales bacterium 8X]|nr:hypothetical protein VARIO8X_120066 [Burkholderiales bacterium 8X]